MSRVRAKIEHQDPTIVVRLTPNGVVVDLQAWQHNAPVRFLEGLDLRIQQAIHQWRARFVAAESKAKVGAPTNSELSDVAHANLRSMA